MSDGSTLESEDVAYLRGLAGVGFLSDIKLPSGRVISAEEAQALSGVFAPAATPDRLRQAEIRARLGVEPYEERTRVPWVGVALLFTFVAGGIAALGWVVVSRWPL